MQMQSMLLIFRGTMRVPVWTCQQFVTSVVPNVAVPPQRISPTRIGSAGGVGEKSTSKGGVLVHVVEDLGEHRQTGRQLGGIDVLQQSGAHGVLDAIDLLHQGRRGGT